MLLSILTATFLVSLSSLAGGLLLIRQKLLAQRAIPYFVSFAAGVLLSASFMDILPEAIEMVEEPHPILMVALLGVVTFFFLERFLLWFHHHDESHGSEPTTVLILLGDSLHNFIDGIVIAAAFLTNPALGITTSLAIAAHEIPHEVADFTVLVHGGMKKTKALFYNFLSSFVAFGGAIGGYFYLSHLQNLIPLLLAFSSGMFIYIACSDLIPDMHKDFKKQKGWTQVLPFIIGIVLTYVSIQLLEH